MAEQGFQVVVAEAVAPVQQLLERPVRIEVVGAAGTAVGALAVADGGVVVAAVHVVAEADVTLDGEREVLEELNVSISLRGGGDALGEALVQFGFPDGAAGVVLRAAVELAGVILHISVLVQEVGAVCIVEVHRIDRSHHMGLVERVRIGGGTGAALVLGLPAGADIDTGGQPGHRGHAGVDTTGPAGEVGVHSLALLVEVAEGEVVVALGGSAGAAHVVVLAVAVAHGVIPPVEVVVAGLDVGSIVELAVCIEQVFGGDIKDIVVADVCQEVRPDIGDGVRHGAHGAAGDEAVRIAVEEHLHEVFGAHLVILRDGAVVHALVRAHGEAHAVALAPLGGDHDDAVGGTVAVKGGGGRILQDGQALDVVRVEVGDVAAEGNAVDDIERGVGTVHGTDTADAEGGIFTRVTARKGENAGGLAFQRVRHAGEGTLGDRFRLDGGNGARHGFALGDTVSDDHKLVQGLAVGRHDDVQGRTRRDLLRLHTDEGDDERLCVRRDAAEIEVTVDIGHGTHLGSLHEDGNACEGIAVLITDGTLHGGDLCECGTCKDQETGQEKKESFHLHID